MKVGPRECAIRLLFHSEEMAGHWQHRVLLALRHWAGRANGWVVFDRSLGIDPGTVQRERAPTL